MIRKTGIDDKAFRALFDFATIGMLVVDVNNTIILANDFASKTFGCSIDELVGVGVEQLIPKRFHPNHGKHVQSFHAKPQSRPMGAGRDLFAVKKNGEEFPVELSLSHFDSDEERFVIVFVIDITVRKNSEELLLQQQQERERMAVELKKLNEQLEKKVEDRTVMLRETLKQLENSRDELTAALEKEKELSDLKSRFVSMASHEFRTPLSAINSSAALLGRYTKAEEQDKRNKHIQRIQEQVKHMNNMLEDLLSLGKLEEGLIEVKPEEFGACEWMKELIDEMNESAPSRKIQLAKTGANTFCTDKKLLRNVAINLLSNAMKFSPEDSVVEVFCDVSENTWKISVADKGIGISEEDKQHLFERFFRAKNASNIQGTGLGLHIVAKYIQLLQGEIEIETELNKGTSITVTLPRLLPFSYHS